MSTGTATPPKHKIALRWLLVFGGTILIFACAFLWSSWREPRHEERPHDLVFLVIISVLGVLFLAAGVAGYFGVLLTNCLTFDFSRPVWATVKGKMFAANIAVTSAFGLGIGFMVVVLLSPVLSSFNITGKMAFMLPVLGVFCIQQCILVWVGIWTPLEKRLIDHRLLALGIKPEQRLGGAYVGLSNPAITSDLKRFGGIEEDLGMLWLTPQQIIYWGDSQQFAITREQLVDAERKADSKSVTMLSGTAHVILHVALPDGSIRQIRLHDEGIWTIGGKRRAADAMSARIDAWRALPVAA